MVRNIEGTPFSLEYFQDSGIHYVAINSSGNFWDHREFDSEADALAFMADPFKDDRAKNRNAEKREAVRDAVQTAHFAHGMTREGGARRTA